jgi:multiple sugar transport system substrate-binding protein
VNRKVKFLGVVALASLVLLTACGGNKEKESGGEKKEEKITIGFWKGDSTAEDKARKTMFDGFTKETGITVEEKVYNDYDTQLMTDLVGGTAPDVFYVDVSNIPSLANQGVLEPLDEYISKSDIKTEDYYKPLLEAFKYTDDKLYGLPKDYSTLGFYYNEELLKKAGLTPEEVPTSYDELEGFLTKIQKALPDVTPMVFSPLMARQMYIMKANGGEPVLEDGKANLSDPKVIENLKILTNLYEKGLIKSPADLGDGWAGDTFGRGGAVISDEGGWMVSHMKTNFPDLKYGVKELPKLNNENHNMVFTVSYSINAGSKKKEEAWKFVEYTTRNEVMQEYAETASVLPTKKL